MQQYENKMTARQERAFWRGNEPSRDEATRIKSARQRSIRGVGLSLGRRKHSERPQSAPASMRGNAAAAGPDAHVWAVTQKMHKILSVARERPKSSSMTAWTTVAPTTRRPAAKDTLARANSALGLRVRTGARERAVEREVLQHVKGLQPEDQHDASSGGGGGGGGNAAYTHPHYQNSDRGATAIESPPPDAVYADNGITDTQEWQGGDDEWGKGAEYSVGDDGAEQSMW